MDPNGFSDEEKEEGVYEHSYYGYTHIEIHLVVVNQFFSALVARCQHPTDKLTLTSIRHLKNKDGEQNDRLHRKSKVKWGEMNRQQQSAQVYLILDGF